MSGLIIPAPSPPDSSVVTAWHIPDGCHGDTIATYNRGALAFLDRYVAWAAGRALEQGEVAQLSRWATEGLRPDLTLLLDLPPEVGLARKQDDEQTRFEAGFDLAYHRRVRAGFLAIATGEPDRFLLIDATATVEVVFELALAAVVSLLDGSTEPSRSGLRIQS